MKRLPFRVAVRGRQDEHVRMQRDVMIKGISQFAAKHKSWTLRE
jgi:hypothetical protein